MSFKAFNRSLAAVVLAATVLPLSATAGDRSGSFSISAAVPASCSTSLNSAVAIAGQGGQLVEACNVPGGFEVTASYRALAPGESVTLNYNGRTIVLSPTGDQVVSQSDLATIRQVNYAFGDVQVSAPLNLTFSIRPIR